MDYGTLLLVPGNKAGLDKLDKLQAKCLRIILGAMKSSPINAMQVECVEPPLSLRRQFLANKLFFKFAEFRDHPLLHKLDQLVGLYNNNQISQDKRSCLAHSYLLYSQLPNPFFQLSKLPLFSMPFNALTFQPLIILDLGINKFIIEANKTFSHVMHSDFQNWHKIFTDASKIHMSPVGVAVWIPSTRIVLSYSCPTVTSVFTGEAIAILEAILFIKSHGLNNSIILSDSKSCLQSILSNPFRSKSRFPIILKIRKNLKECYDLNINIVLAWIPGHAGIIGNENADACARSAAHTGSQQHSQIFSHDLCSTLKINMFERWSNIWQVSKTAKGVFYGDIQPVIPLKPWFSKFRFPNKSIISTVCRLRLNHSCTPVFLAKLRIRDHSLCECGLDEGNVDHLFFNCPLMKSSLYNFIPPEIPRPTSMKCLLTFVFTPFVNTLCIIRK
ncbi:uncharacterized protein LOC126970503 isoform X1 [Leptidea sinapis]|uniref:uncharacterized protein LOC126970503 isoform X1 n=2 Tax=Leptidea sinapis TaxID=189913 RepID=UPI0021C42D2F|nr:uncharacterized protein LOC126970503 isoform X1 [Leptidea sinapis]